MALERLEPSFSTFSIFLRFSMIESPQEMSNTQIKRIGELPRFARDSLHSRTRKWRTKAWHDDAN